ncbi:2-dehydro-3-deoxygalactonokinase [Dyadobacter sandarakinus]|uniref:2-dehydro-3-deoxygalactonokinase n=1 Tax=Dyadobacter sandarakinus TaxID=2747268 RepID=A0ABX7I130_9BACT|nr:2-dehydro-3-deoxygalactonokinase [Dyadobacter sandarakinus]QRQ99534.1 2-dehydro-3-deoxygalactonokinase [Dyadobacter sandarakinus]
MSKYLLSCDWGTTSFRLRLVDVRSRACVGEVMSGKGVSSTFNEWQAGGGGVSREDFFRGMLLRSISELGGRSGFDLTNIPVVVSGMASSSIGMLELPYAEVPFALDSSGMLVRYLGTSAAFPYEILLVSGVRSSDDVMRGEETQLIGLYELAGVDEDVKTTFVFPGTHSKHLYVQEGKMAGFKTFMTGELFNLMVSGSILKDSVILSKPDEYTPELWDAFRLGVVESGKSPILHALFTVRTRQLFGLLSKKQNAMYLSGLLIGAELRELTGEAHNQVVLCGGENLSAPYRQAIRTLGLAGRTRVIAPELSDQAAVYGHIRIFEHQRITLNKTSI